MPARRTNATPVTRCSPLEAHLGFWLRFVSNHVSLAFRRQVEARGVTVAEWVALRVLFERDGLNPSQVAEALGMTRGAISKLLERLARGRLVRVRRDARDRRFQAVSLTAAGRRLVPQLAALADRNEVEFFAHLSAAERAGLIALLQDIVRRRGLKAVPVE